MSDRRKATKSDRVRALLGRRGFSRADIARRVGVDPALVTRLAQDRSGVSPVFGFDTGRALELWNCGCSDAEIARQIGVHVMTIRRWRRFSGMESKFLRPPKSPHPLLRKILTYRSRGKSYGQIGLALGVSRSVVAGALDRHRMHNYDLREGRS